MKDFIQMLKLMEDKKFDMKITKIYDDFEKF